MAGVGPLIIHLAPNQNVVFPLICGSVSALISCFLVWFVKVKTQNQEEKVFVGIHAGGH